MKQTPYDICHMANKITDIVHLHANAKLNGRVLGVAG